MKARLKGLIREETGAALVLTLVLLVLGGLILTPLMGHIGSGHIAGQVHEKRMDELYAADAGVEHAIWMIRSVEDLFDDDYYSYPDADSDEPWMINEKSVSFEIWRTDLEGSTVCHMFEYHIRSTAETIDGSTTIVDSLVTSTDLDFSHLSGSAITSGDGVKILGQTCTISGDIVLAEDGILDVPGDFAHEDGKVIRGNLTWPEGEHLDSFIDFFRRDAKSGTHYYGDTIIDLEGQNLELGPIYVEGTLDIVNSVNTLATLTLTGTIFATDDTSIGQSHRLVINLNSETIFVESASRKPPDAKEALYVKGKCGIDGPGALIALGDIHFEPNIEAGTDGPVLVYSVAGTTHVWPNGAFYGSVVGRYGVDLQPNNTIVYPEGESPFTGIHFPGLIQGKEMYRVDSWTITTTVPDKGI